MVSVSLLGGLPVAHSRRVLSFLVAAAMALGPVGTAMAAARTPHVDPAQSMQAQPQQTHAEHHQHGRLPVVIPETHGAQEHCDGNNSSDCCCGDGKANCTETCLTKCFGQLGLIPPDQAACRRFMGRLIAPALEWPPDWSHDPQTPPPRA